MYGQRYHQSLDLMVEVCEPAAKEPPTQSSTSFPEHVLCKNRLQEYAQRSGIPLPIYQTINEGFQHSPMFRSTVLVDNTYFTSPNTFPHRKAAEQEVASVALASITQKLKEEGYPLIREDTVFCKSILNEYAVKMNLEKPAYTTIQPKGLLPVFESSLVFNGVNYTGEAGRSKKEAEQLAARAVILSFFVNSESAAIISEIIKSKFRLYAALHKVKDSPSTQNGNSTLAVNTGPGFGFPMGNEKEVEITRNGNMPLAMNTGTGFGFPMGSEKEVGIPRNANMPLAMNTGTGFGFPMGNEKEGGIIRSGNTPLAINSGTGFGCPMGNEKEVGITSNGNTPLSMNTGTGFGRPMGNEKEVGITSNGNTPQAMNTGTGFGRPMGNEKEVGITRNGNMPLAMNTGTGFGRPMGNEKEVGITRNGNTPLAMNTRTGFGRPLGNETRVEITGGANNVTSTSNIPPMHQPFHESKRHKWEASSGACTPIVFVPSALEQPQGASPLSSSAKKRNRRKKKKAMKKAQADAQMPIDVVHVVPIRQVAPCSVAQ